MRKDHSVMRVNDEAGLRQAHHEVHAFKDDGRMCVRRLDGCESSKKNGKVDPFFVFFRKGWCGCHP